MSKNSMNKIAVFSAMMILCIFLGSCLLGNGGGNFSKDPEIHTISLKSEGNMIFKDVEITVYENSDMEELVWKGTTDNEGKLTFNAVPSGDYVAVINGIPDGYALKNEYSIDSTNVNIVVKTKLDNADKMFENKYKLGSIVSDFTVSDYNGNEYTVSELLKTKKAVVLNFWFINCGPCKMEFPYLQSSYLEHSDSIALIALNPTGDTNESIDQFAKENNLTFPMGACDSSWGELLDLNAYPTTVVIDRYGMISMIHKGYITEKETFDKIFEYYSDENYVQSIVRNISDVLGTEGE